MGVLRIILTVLLIIDCVAVTVIVLMQEGKQAGLGAMAGGMQDTSSYWSKNKSRSKEGKLITITKILVVAFFLLSILLNLSVI